MLVFGYGFKIWNQDKRKLWCCCFLIIIIIWLVLTVFCWLYHLYHLYLSLQIQTYGSVVGLELVSFFRNCHCIFTMRLWSAEVDLRYKSPKVWLFQTFSSDWCSFMFSFSKKSEPRPSVTETLRCLSCRSLFRRHADGTYTSDVSSYLQDQAAKEFVSWLKTGRGRRE